MYFILFNVKFKVRIDLRWQHSDPEGLSLLRTVMRIKAPLI